MTLLLSAEAPLESSVTGLPPRNLAWWPRPSTPPQGVRFVSTVWTMERSKTGLLRGQRPRSKPCLPEFRAEVSYHPVPQHPLALPPIKFPLIFRGKAERAWQPSPALTASWSCLSPLGAAVSSWTQEPLTAAPALQVYKSGGSVH